MASSFSKAWVRLAIGSLGRRRTIFSPWAKKQYMECAVTRLTNDSRPYSTKKQVEPISSLIFLNKKLSPPCAHSIWHPMFHTRKKFWCFLVIFTHNSYLEVLTTSSFWDLQKIFFHIYFEIFTISQKEFLDL